MAELSESERRRLFHQRAERKLDHLHGQYGIDAVVHHDYVPPDGNGYADVAWLARRPLSLLADGQDVPVAAFRLLSDADRDAVRQAIDDLAALRPAVGWLVMPDDLAVQPGWGARPGETFADAVRDELQDGPSRVLVRSESDLDRMLGGDHG